MKYALLKTAFLAALASRILAADFKIPDLDKLAGRAKETVDVTLDRSTLQLATAFLSKDDPDDAQIKKIVANLKGVFVRSYEFEKEGEYSLRDVEAMRAQLKDPAWSRIVGVRSIKGENTEVYLLRNGDRIDGLVVLDAEPKELTIVHIDGPLNPEDLARLSGHLGIPQLGPRSNKKSSKEED